MERLEIIKDVVAIFRDLLIIIAFVVMIFTGLTVLNFLNALNPNAFSCSSVVNSVVSGDFSVFVDVGQQKPAATYTPSTEMDVLIGEIEAAANAGNKETAVSKLDELKILAEQAEMPLAVAKIDELKTAIEEENYVKALGTANQLKALFNQ